LIDVCQNAFLKTNKREERGPKKMIASLVHLIGGEYRFRSEDLGGAQPKKENRRRGENATLFFKLAASVKEKRGNYGGRRLAM